MKLRYKITGILLILMITGIAWLGWYVSHNEECQPAPTLTAGVEQMNAIRYSCFGGPEVLEFASVEKPAPGDNEVLIKVKAAGVNPLDWHYMRGTPYIVRLMGAGIGKPADPGLGVDFSGIVESVGTGVTKFQAGDRVFGGHHGAFSQYLTMDADKGVVPMPEISSFELAGVVPIAGITALQALRDAGKLQPGQKVLINGASGGVGTFAVQIAKAMGAEVHGVCSTRNVALVAALGADRVIDYKKESYVEGSEKYDLIIDNVGNHSLLANRNVMNPKATLVMVGGSGGDWVGFMWRPLSAMFIGPFIDQNFAVFIAKMKPEDLVTLADLIRSGQVKPVIDRTYPLAEVPDAIRYSETGRARGKIAIRVQE